MKRKAVWSEMEELATLWDSNKDCFVWPPPSSGSIWIAPDGDSHSGPLRCTNLQIRDVPMTFEKIRDDLVEHYPRRQNNNPDWKMIVALEFLNHIAFTTKEWKWPVRGANGQKDVVVDFVRYTENFRYDVDARDKIDANIRGLPLRIPHKRI